MRKILSFFIAILFASSMMAEVGSLYYTFLPYKPSSGAVSDYTKTGTMTIDEMKWTVPGNWYATGGLRLGGKSLSGVDRTIIGQDPMGSAISKIRIAHAGVTSDKIVLNSVTVTTASDADFTQDVTTKTVTEFTVAKNTKDTIDVVPTTEPWAINSYYKVAFNFTNSVNSNYAFVVESILFYAYAEGGDDPQPTTQDLYLKLSSDWEDATTNFAAYYFNDTENGWSEMMTAVTGETNIYKTTIPVGFSKVIFVRFQSGATTPRWDAYNDEWYVWSQTANLTMEEGKDMFTLTSGGTGSECNGTWSKYTPATPPEDITFYLVNKQGWEAPKAFVFNATASEEDWPGKAMTKTENTVNGFDVYSYTFKDNFTSIIFNNGAATGTIQTADLAWDATKPYFVPGKVNGEGKFEGTWYASLEAIPAPVYNIAGAFTGWKPYALNVANDKNTATLDVQLPAGEYEFKVVRIEGTDTTWYTKNNGDAGAYGLHREYVGVEGVNEQADNNLKVTADEAGAYLFTWTFANDSVGITFPAKHVLNETWSVDDKTAVAAETQYVDNYAINIKSVYGTTLKENARTFGGFAFSHAIQVRTDGYPSATNLVGAEKSGSTSLVITAKEDVEITMYYNRQVVSGAGTENDNKDIIVVDQAAPTTKLTGAFKIVEILSGNSYLNATKTLSLTKGHVYTVTASGTTLQLSGIRYASDAVKDPEMQIAGAWDIQEENWVVNNMTLAQDKKTATYEVELAKGEYEFKVIKDGAWLTKDNGEAGAFGLHRGYPGVAGIKDDAANNLKVTADVSGAYLFTWTLANDSLNIAFPALPKFCVTGDSALVVDAGLDKAKAWNDEAFMSNADEFVLTGLKADQEYHLQVIVGEAWKGYSNLSEKAAGLKAGGEFGNNIVFKLAEAGDVKVTYKAAEGETPELFKLEGNFYYYQPTLVDLKLVPGVWAEADAKIAAWAWTRKEGAEMVDQWTPFFAPIAEGNDTLSVKIDAAADSILFVRFNNEASVPTWDGGKGYIWGQMSNDSIVKESMTYTITDWAAGTWDVYVPAKFYIVGDSALVGSKDLAWNPAAIKVTEDSKVLDLEAGSYMMKITLKGDWEHGVLGYDALTGEKPAGITRGEGDNNDNICFTLKEAGQVTVSYIATETDTTFTIAGNFYYYQPTLVDLKLVPGVWAEADAKIAAWAWTRKEGAEMVDQWTPFFAPIAEGNDTLSVKIDAAADSIQFIRFNKAVESPVWSDAEDVIWNRLASDSIVKESMTYTITDWAAGTWDVYVPAKYYITGIGGWDQKQIKATADEYVFENLKADTVYTLKVLPEGLWEGGTVLGFDELTTTPEGVFADNDKNVCFKLAEAGNVTVTYKVENEKVTFTVAGNFYVEPKINLQLVPNKWAEEDAKIAAWIWRTGENGTWTEFFAPKAEENDTLVMAIPQSMDSVIFARFNKTVTEPKWTEEADYIWNSLAGDTIDKLGLTYTITDYWAGTWDVYVPAMFYVTGDSALVKDAAGLEKKDEWNAKAIKAEQDTLVLSLKADQEYKLKLIEDGNWEGGKVYGYDALTQEDKAGLSADNDNNIVFKLNEDGDVKVVYFWEEDTEIDEWKMTFKLIGDFYVAPVDPTEHTYTVAGNLTDAFGTAWDPENAANDMVKQEDGTYKWEKAELTLAAGTISFKIVEDHSWDVAYPASDYNLNIAEQGEYTLTITFNPETKAVDAVATKTGDAEVTVNYYLVGSVKGWEAKAENIFTLNAEAGEGIEEYVIETTLEVGEGLKVLSSIGTWYPDGTGNEYVVDQNHAGATTIYFRPAYNEEWAAFGGYMYVVPTDPTALDEIMAAGKAVKILRDGQILIIKGNKTFNIQGQLVK